MSAEAILRLILQAEGTQVITNNNRMKKTLFTMLTAIAVGISMITVTSCNDGETYAEQKAKEKKAIQRFIKNNSVIGPIKVISEAQFYANDSTTDVSKNEFVEFKDDGIYMQIVRQPEGKTMAQMALERSDSTISKPIVCKFMEYDIENADTTLTNYYSSSIAEKMQVSYSHHSRRYSASFTSGYMLSNYKSTVPEGWLKPLDYIKLSYVDGLQAKVRIIVPHTSGTDQNAVKFVLPFYYEITYLLPPNS